MHCESLEGKYGVGDSIAAAWSGARWRRHSCVERPPSAAARDSAALLEPLQLAPGGNEAITRRSSATATGLAK
jgi:hypothetical protein